MRTRLAVFLIAILGTALASSSSQAQTWAEKLGFPPESRVVILDGREAGINWETNEACKQLLEKGRLSSVEVVATGPWFEDMAKWHRTNDGYDLGLSIALHNPYPAPSWQLISFGFGPTTMVNADGKPWRNLAQLRSNVTAADVKQELDAQILRAKQAGLEISHLTTLHGSAFCRADLAAVFLGAAKKYWIPAPVVELTPALTDHFRNEGFPIDDAMLEMVANYPLPKLDDLKFSPIGNTYEEKLDAYRELLRRLQPGLTMITFRPAVETKGIELSDEAAQQRVWDAKLLDDPTVVELMQSEEIIVTNWREIMDRFEQPAPFVPAAPDTDQE